MTHPASGNPVWQDFPSTDTLISAAALNAIESFLDRYARPADGGMATYIPNAAQSIAAAGSPKLIQFAAGQRATSLVTRNFVSPGHTFTLGATALWAVSLSVGMNNTSAGVKRVSVTQSGTSDVNAEIALANLTTNTTGVGVIGGNSWVGRLESGTVLSPFAYSTTADTLVVANTSLAIAYLGPA